MRAVTEWSQKSEEKVVRRMGPMWHGYVGIAEREMKRANFEF